VALLSDDRGAVVSASHNPPEYNGVKFFDAGYKLSDEEEEAIEAHLDDPPPFPDSESIEEQPGLAEQYVEVACARFGAPMDGLEVVLDCANGAMFEVAPQAFTRLGAHVVTIGNGPDGMNINEGCGATDLRLLSHTVAQGDFDLGIAFDGDGDRMLAVDAEGQELDGDRILAILAVHLDVELVAVTQMTNLGFHELMDERGIRVVTTEVGDRYVLEALRREQGILGGEQSGHVIYLDGHTSGDGLAAALLLCRAVVEKGQSLAELATIMAVYPQAKKNVTVRTKDIPEEVSREIEKLNAELGPSGRILVRPSGTEPVIRILTEAKTPRIAGDLCARIEALVSRELG
jgi:phosphoglucosamine mutase